MINNKKADNGRKRLREEVWHKAKKKFSGNIAKFYVYRALFTMMFFVPVFVLFMQEKGLTMTEIMLTEAFYGVVIIIIKIPCGAFADMYGRKLSIILSSVMVCIAAFFIVFAANFWHFMLIQFVWAFASGLWSGVNNAFIYDTLKEQGNEDKYIKVEANVMTIEMIGYALSSSVAGLIAKHGLEWNFLLTMPFILAALIISCLFREPKAYTRQDKKYVQHIKDSINYARTHKRLRFFLVYSMVFLGICKVTWMFNQPYLSLIKIDVSYFGIIYALMFIVSAIGARLAERIEKKLGEKLTIVGLAFLAGLFCLLAGLVPEYYAFVFLLGFSLVEGAAAPLMVAYINHHVESSQRATIISLRELGLWILYSIMAPLMGYVTDKGDASIVFVVIGVMLIVDAIVIVVIFLYGDNGKV